MAFGKRAYLRNHQGLTHSLLLTPVFALMLIALPLSIALCFGIYSVYLYDYYFVLPGYVSLSFFLFCNVFRIGNKLEPV